MTKEARDFEESKKGVKKHTRLREKLYFFVFVN